MVGTYRKGVRSRLVEIRTRATVALRNALISTVSHNKILSVNVSEFLRKVIKAFVENRMVHKYYIKSAQIVDILEIYYKEVHEDVLRTINLTPAQFRRIKARSKLSLFHIRNEG